MNYENLSSLIQENSDESDFTSGITAEEVIRIESALNVEFPQSYKWFLENYGSGGLFGVDILGYGKSSPSVVSKTEKLRNLGMPYGYIVIEDCEEFFYCLDTTDISKGECSVISWDRISGFNGKRADNFYEFLFERLSDAKENWEED
ncbi:SMI1/KNR4 family protein [Paenibacillus sonchi]|uniref:SMI1/KNR4 family protein n=1 Tax=Paenibacillus sonchi TaxID=373687 RepID=UPI0005849221|nr:SMI1/KNR4 family protein [Paenibacillus sonchi]